MAINQPAPAEGEASNDPFVAAPLALLDLVADGKVSKNAAWLYLIMLSYRNRKRGDNGVWPSRRTLAQRMNMSVTRTVDRYVDELVDAGLIRCDRRRSGQINDTNRYDLLLVPSGGGGVQTNTRGSAHPDTRGSAETNTRVVLDSTPGVVLRSAPEPEELQPDEFEPEEGEPSLSPHASENAAARTNAKPKPRERDGEESSRNDHKTVAAEILGRRGYNPAQIKYITRWITRRCGVTRPGFWTKVDLNGDLDGLIGQAIAEHIEEHGPSDEPDAKPCPLHRGQLAGRCAACIGDAKAAGTMRPSAQARPRSTGAQRAQEAMDAAAELQAVIDANGGKPISFTDLLHSRVPTGPVSQMSPGDRAAVRGAELLAKYAAMEAAGQHDPNIIEGEEVA